MPNQHTTPNPAPRRCRQVRFTDAEWAEIKAGAHAIGETRSEAIRAGAMSRVRQSIPDASDVTPFVPGASLAPIPGAWTVHKAETWSANSPTWHDAKDLPPGAQLAAAPPLVDFDGTVRPPPTEVFACAYCNAEFCTSFDAEAHVDSMHQGEP